MALVQTKLYIKPTRLTYHAKPPIDIPTELKGQIQMVCYTAHAQFVVQRGSKIVWVQGKNTKRMLDAAIGQTNVFGLSKRLILPRTVRLFATTRDLWYAVLDDHTHRCSWLSTLILRSYIVHFLTSGTTHIVYWDSKNRIVLINNEMRSAFYSDVLNVNAIAVHDTTVVSIRDNDRVYVENKRCESGLPSGCRIHSLCAHRGGGSYFSLELASMCGEEPIRMFLAPNERKWVADSHQSSRLANNTYYTTSYHNGVPTPRFYGRVKLFLLICHRLKLCSHNVRRLIAGWIATPDTQTQLEKEVRRYSERVWPSAPLFGSSSKRRRR